MKKLNVSLTRFNAGLWSARNPISTPDGAVSDCVNVVFDATAPVSTRPGYGRFTSSDITGKPVRTIFPWELSNGTRVILTGVRNTGAATNEVYSINESGIPGTAAVTGGTGFATTYDMEFSAAVGNVYMANGSDALQWYNGTTMAAAGVDATVAGAITGAIAAGGNIPAATYVYRTTYVYGSRGESHAQNESGNVVSAGAPGNATASLTTIPVGPTGCTLKRIYRRDTSSVNNPFVFVGEIAAATTTFSDDNSQLDMARRARTTTATPPISRFLVWHQNRMFYLWQTGDRSRWWWSELRTPDIVLTTSTEYTSRDDGQEITASCSFRDILCVFKSRSLWIVEGTGPNDWTQRRITDRVGCAHHRTIQVTPRGVYFMGQEGVWIFDGVSVKYLSEGIEPLFRNILQGWNSSALFEWTDQRSFGIAGSSPGGQSGSDQGGGIPVIGPGGIDVGD